MKFAFDDVVLIVSASRSGSSLIAEYLKENARVSSLQGEVETVLREAGAVAMSPLRLDEFDGDIRLDAEVGPSFLDLLAKQAGHSPRDETAIDVEAYGATLHKMLCRQWPGQGLTFGAVASAARQVLDALGNPRVGALDRWKFMIELLGRLRENRPAINPYCYDIPAELVRASFPELAPFLTGPDPDCCEDRPFILPAPWVQAGPAPSRRTILIKGPSCSYRLSAFGALFARRLRIVHIGRHPGASINGLLDGWRHQAFQSRRLTEPLNIKDMAWARDDWRRFWWCFDVPPQWSEYRSAALIDIALHQWRSANCAILDYLRAAAPPYRYVRFEDFLSDDAVGASTRRALVEWVGGEPVEGAGHAASILRRPVMATAAPRSGRWRDRAALLRPALGEVRELGSALGYDVDR